MMKRKNKRLLAACTLAIILIVTAYPYLAEIGRSSYQSDDYVFLSQVTQHGLWRSLMIPFRDHFVPLYRLLMGGLYVLSASAIPISVSVLGFHLINTSLIFSLVLGRTESVALSATASVTFGLSNQALNCLSWSINGYIVVSLSFVLLMWLCFGRFLDSEGNSRSQPGPSSGSPRLHAQHEISFLGAYYIGLALLAIALGFSTLAFVGGLLVWLFMYVRLLRIDATRRTLKYHAAMVLPFLLVMLVYLLARSYFNYKYLPLQDTLYQNVESMPSFTLAERADIVRAIPANFYACLVTQMLPYFGTHYFLVPAFFVLLLTKEFWHRKREAWVTLFWLGFAFLTAAVPTFGRIFHTIKVAHSLFFVIAPHYFCYSIAGVSIALGFLLRPTPRLEGSADPRLSVARTFLFAGILGLLVLFNKNRVAEIRSSIVQRTEESMKFERLLTQYRNSMTSFLKSPAYSPHGEFYFEDAAAAAWSEYRSSFSVRKSHIFYLYFPSVKTIRFIEPGQENGVSYLWTPEGVRKK